MIVRAIIVSTLALGIAGLIAVLARRASASVRHAIWLVGITTSLGVAVISAFGPIDVEATVVNAPGVVPFPAEFFEALPGPNPLIAPIADLPKSSDFRLPDRPVLPNPLLLAWLAGVILVIGRVVAGHIGVARLIRRSTTYWRGAAMSNSDVRLSGDVDAPFTLGTRRAVILLPAEAETWTDERLRIVLVHELAHVARLDYAAQLIATTACAIYWFNPITWLAAARLRAEAEHAADDRVLAAGVDGVTYASHLLELARPETGTLSTAMAVGMARGNRLERRFTAMLDSTRSRGIVPLRLQAIAGSVAMLVAVPLTALRVIPVAKAAPTPIVGKSPSPEVKKPVSEPTPQLAVAPTRQVIRADTIIDRTLAASAGESISINLRSGGGVVVRSWNQQQVRVRGVLSGTQARETQVVFQRVGRGLELRTTVPESDGRRNQTNSNSFELWVPARFDVTISSGGGEVSITGVQGRFVGSTGGGEITLENLSGYADLTTGGGEVLVTNSTLDGRVSTGGGEAIVTNTTGNVRVTSGSGPVIRDGSRSRSYGIGGLDPQTSVISSGQSTSIRSERRPLIIQDGNVISGGDVSFSRAGGDIQLDDVPSGGSFTTGGGGIVIRSLGGDAQLTTGGGDITVGSAAGDVTATTGAGAVQITLTGSGSRNVHVTSGNGRVIIDVPANLDVRFDLESAYTERHGKTSIQSDIPLNLTEVDEWDYRNGTPRKYVRASGGNGRGVIKVRTVNGDVVIRRR